MIGKITHVAEDGAVTDVTGAVQALYDLAISSQNFGSGFWSAEDAVPVAFLARACGFEQAAEVEKYITVERMGYEARTFHRSLPPMPTTEVFEELLRGHSHVFSSKGTCMWPGCRAEQEPAEG